MSERKFARSLGKPGTAAQLRETVSQVVRESTVQNKPLLVEPIDFENFILKNKTLLQNDSQRELLLYPADDISQIVLPRRYRTTTQTVPSKSETEDCNLFTKQCITSYSSNWNLIHYKYSAYSGTYAELPKLPCNDNLKEETFEIDIDSDNAEDFQLQIDGITKEGYLMKGPEIGSDRMFVNIGSKSFKRRYCYLRQEVDGTYILELFKDERKGEAKLTIVMDFCTEVVKNPKRGRFCFELRMTAGHKSYMLGAENETEFKDWLAKLSSVLQQNKVQEEKRAASLERDRSSPIPQVPAQPFGTLKGLEHSMNPQLIKYARETDISIAMSRRENRSKLFTLYPQLSIALNSKSSHSGGLQDQIEPYKEMFGTRVFVKCETISFKLQAPGEGDRDVCQIEPYHTTLCLFDAKIGRKLTENFHFDVNHPIVHSMGHMTNGVRDGRGDGPSSPKTDLPPNLSREWLLYPKQALLSITNPHPDIFLVVRIEKVLQGGICQASEPYIKVNKDIFLVVRIEKVLQGGICQASEPYIKVNKDPKAALKVYKSVLASCQRLGHYKMPFAWTARPLFRLYSNELDTTSDFPGIFRQESNKLTDEELLRLLSEYRKPDKFSKLTVIPGSLKIKISSLNEIPENTLTTAIAALKPFPIPPTNEPTIEITEFEKNSEKDVHPYTTFINHLYVYPQMLNFDTQKMFTRARNIACVVELKDSDDENAVGLQCIYGRPGQTMLVSQVSCAVLHHNTVPTWYEEVKIRLPIHLHHGHHLLFTFYHISCDTTKKRENGVESCVGYAWIPLLCKGKLNVDRQVVPVAAHLPIGYLSIHPFGLGKGVSFFLYYTT
ncbi:PH domain [Popillia japonica]|uniref:PH domain n=1 Tax=Popillia japonica TaxID=7064 RepID=A0AAW1KIR1_POPJA